jgi:hypothetical protein
MEKDDVVISKDLYNEIVSESAERQENIILLDYQLEQKTLECEGLEQQLKLAGDRFDMMLRLLSRQ